MEIIKDHNGNEMYRGMSLELGPEEVKDLDPKIVEQTLSYYEFIANMSDSYEATLSEMAAIKAFREQNGFVE